MLVAIVVLIGSTMVMSALTLKKFETTIEPAVEAKIEALAATIENEIVSVHGYGIPMDSMNGVDEYFDSLARANPEIMGLALTTAHGTVFQSSNFTKSKTHPSSEPMDFPLVVAGESLGQLQVLRDGTFSRKKSQELLLDVITVVTVSVIIAIELIVFIVSFNISRVEKKVDFIRWPFFLLVFSESLSLSFFPTYVGHLEVPNWGLPQEFVIGLPISIFMFIWALTLPGGGVWSDTVGRRRAFVVGAVLASVGLALTSFSYSLFDLLVWRSLTAIGYGLVFITVQGFITDNTDASNRNKGMATFVATFFAGSLSGAAVGGILADHFGMPYIFLFSAVMSLAAAIFVARFLSPGGGQPRPKLTFKSIREICGDRAFLMITLFSAIPSKIALTGFLYFSAPLFLNSLSVSKSTAGRAIMLYGLMIICLSPLVAHYADRFKSRLPLVLFGGALGSLAIAILAFAPTLPGLMFSIALLGVAHAISVPSQLTFITETNQELCQKLGLGQVVGIFRLIERIGNILGPIIAGVFIAIFGLNQAFVYLALLIASSTIILGVWVRLQRGQGVQS